MRKLVVLLILFQAVMLTRCPSGLGMEAILAGKAWSQGIVPYTGFKMHIGPVVPALFAVLYSIPRMVWFAIVFGIFNLLAAWGLYQLCGSLLAVGLFLILNGLFEGNAWHVETVMLTFGVWAFVFARDGRKWLAVLMVALATLTKQTGLIYALALLP